MPPLNLGGFKWNKTAARYVDARGRFVSIDAVRRALDTALEANRRSMASLATALQSGNISLEQWRASMRAGIKNSQLYSAAAARGGWAQMTNRDLGRVGQRVRYNYGRLERFAQQIARSEVPLDGRFVVRAGLYAGNAKATYHRVEVETQVAAGYDEERNLLRPADHCGECVALTRKGWVPIGTTTPIGERECLGNCQCGMEYRKGVTAGPVTGTPLDESQQSPQPVSVTPIAAGGFVPAETIAAAERVAEEMYVVQKADYSGFTLQSANETNRALHKLVVQEGLPLVSAVLTNPKTRQSVATPYGVIIHGSEAFDDAELQKRWAVTLANAEKNGRVRPAVVNSIYDLTIHEYGHVAHQRMRDGGYNFGGKELGASSQQARFGGFTLTPAGKKAAREISEYAATDTIEHFAEAFTAYLRGEPVSAKVRRVIEDVIAYNREIKRRAL